MVQQFNQPNLYFCHDGRGGPDRSGTGVYSTAEKGGSNAKKRTGSPGRSFKSLSSFHFEEFCCFYNDPDDYVENQPGPEKPGVNRFEEIWPGIQAKFRFVEIYHCKVV